MYSALPLAYATSCNVDGSYSQPSTNYVGSYSTVQDAINSLPSRYNKITAYAAAFTHNYTDWVTAYGCTDGVFRYQTSIVDHDGSGDYEHGENHLPSEPNPEVLGYWWPVYWWGLYVEDWNN